MWIALGIGGGIVVIGYIWYVKIIGCRNKAQEAFSGIDVRLKKRRDLIPNILTIAKRFECYATDQIEARYLLTPAFMERLTALATHIGNGRLQASFYDQKLFIMVPVSKNLFEPPSIFTSVLKDTGVNRLATELGDMLSIIDILKLDERTGL